MFNRNILSASTGQRCEESTLAETVNSLNTVEELETNLMSLIMFITLNICSTCFEH